jgi:hypothetical protein
MNTDNPMYGGTNQSMYKMGNSAQSGLGAASFLVGTGINLSTMDHDKPSQYITHPDMSSPYVDPGMYHPDINPYKQGAGLKQGLSGAASGAAAGSAFGPIGTAVGAGVGLLSGVVAGAINQKHRNQFNQQEAAAHNEFNMQQQRYDNYQNQQTQQANQSNYYARQYQNAYNMPSYGQAYFSV